MKIDSVVVVLDRDLKDEDAEMFINTLRMIKGVANVIPHEPNGSDIVARQRERNKLTDMLYEIIEKLQRGI